MIPIPTDIAPHGWLLMSSCPAHDPSTHVYSSHKLSALTIWHSCNVLFRNARTQRNFPNHQLSICLPANIRMKLQNWGPVDCIAWPKLVSLWCCGKILSSEVQVIRNCLICLTCHVSLGLGLWYEVLLQNPRCLPGCAQLSWFWLFHKPCTPISSLGRCGFCQKSHHLPKLPFNSIDELCDYAFF